MPEILPEHVRHLASLARIDLDEAETSALTADLAQILANVEKIQQVAGPEVPATSHPIPLTNVSREDRVAGVLTQEQALRNAPDAQAGRFRVPAILGEEQ